MNTWYKIPAYSEKIDSEFVFIIVALHGFTCDFECGGKAKCV